MSELRTIPIFGHFVTLCSAKFAPNADYEDKFTPRIKTNQKHLEKIMLELGINMIKY